MIVHNFDPVFIDFGIIKFVGIHLHIYLVFYLDGGMEKVNKKTIRKKTNRFIS